MNDLATLRAALAALRAQNINPYSLVALDYLETARDLVNSPEASEALRHCAPVDIAIGNWQRDGIIMSEVIGEVAYLAPERYL